MCGGKRDKQSNNGIGINVHGLPGEINEYYKNDMGLKSLTHLRPRKEQGLVFVTMLRFYMGKK